MRFSVIIPVYNKANTLRAAVESVLAQTFRDFEIVVVDDGSKDSPEKELSEFIGSHIRLIHQENSGVSVARNTGIANAKGDYVCFLDADDLWLIHHLEVLDDLIKRYPQSRSFITSHEIITPEANSHHSFDALTNYDTDFETDDLLGLLNTTSYSVVHTNSVCVQRTLLEQEKIYFEPGVKIGEDSDVWYRLGMKYPVALTKKETTQYQRAYSTATRDGFYVQGWIFSLRAEEILADPLIADKVKTSYIRLIDRYKMTGSREYMVEGCRAEAKRILREVTYKKGKRYVLTKIFTCLPYWMCKKMLNKQL